MSRLILFSITQILISQLSGQGDYNFSPPVQIPLYLSGNFGEIRADHMHSGIDIKTQGVIGQPVSSIEKGYVSRIKVQANGYGKSIYVTHPQGYTSVYGHLDRYREDIADYVKKLQYNRHSHMLDIYLEPEIFPLDKGELIAYSGNTGSSSGPHLHFEIRTASNQHPTNVLKYNFKVKDEVSPRFRSIYMYPLDKESQVNGSPGRFSSPLVKDQGVYAIPYGTKLEAGGTLGISVEVFDYLDGASNRCGVYSLELYVDEVRIYRYVMDEFSFGETRYVNAHMDYEEWINSGTKAHRLHRLPNDRLRLYDHLVNDGALLIDENRNYDVRIVAADVAGNSSELRFKISGNDSQPVIEPEPASFIRNMKYQESNLFEQDPVTVLIPRNALYQDMDFSYEVLPPSRACITDFYHLGSATIPVHLPYTLSIKSPVTEAAMQNKLLIVTLNEDGELSAVGGDYKAGVVSAEVRNFGLFALAIDSIPPQVTPVGRKITGDLRGMDALKFQIVDKLSGIHSYEGYIDGQWVLFEYDLKNDLLVYTFDKAKIKSNTTHELELYISDSNGNTNLFLATFTW